MREMEHSAIFTLDNEKRTLNQAADRIHASLVLRTVAASIHYSQRCVTVSDNDVSEIHVLTVSWNLDSIP